MAKRGREAVLPTLAPSGPTTGRGRPTIIPDTAHMTMLEAPSVFNTALLEFLAGLEIAGKA